MDRGTFSTVKKRLLWRGVAGKSKVEVMIFGAQTATSLGIVVFSR